MSVRQLTPSVTKLIGSTQIISSISSVVKELVENSIDAGATVIDIKLDRNGIDKIEVRDNGSGICVSDVEKVCLSHYTSKLCKISDFEILTSYGFRGEALNSLCAVANVSITTKTENDKVAYTYIYDNNGAVINSVISHQMKGTIVTVTGLFKNVPVRKQYYTCLKKATDELKCVERIVKLLAVIHPKIRVTITHNKCLIWQKTSSYSLRESLMYFFPQHIVKNLDESYHTFNDITIEMLIPKTDCYIIPLCQSSVSDSVLFFVNKRPVKDKKVEQLIIEEMSHYYASTLPHNKCPVCVISLTLPPENIDVNVEPNKTRVFIKDHDDVLKNIREAISIHFYHESVFDKNGENLEINNTQDCSQTKKQKMNDLDLCESTISTDSASQILQNCKRDQISQFEEKNDNDLSIVRNEFLDVDKRNSNHIFHVKGKIENSASVGEVSKSNQSNIRLTNLHLDAVETLSKVPNFKDKLPEISKLIPTLKNAQITQEFNKISAVYNKITSNGDTIGCRINQQNVCSISSVLSSNNKIAKYDGGMMQFLNNIKKTEISNTEDSTDVACKNLNVENNGIECTTAERNEYTTAERNEYLSSSEINDNSEKKNEFPNIDSENTTLSQWSKGNVVLNGCKLEGGTTLLGSKKNIASNFQYAKKKPFTVEEDLSSHNRSVSSQFGNKELSGFTKFAREIRSDIIKNSPGISFTKVASELASRWRNLQDEDRNQYLKKSKLVKKQKTNLPLCVKPRICPKQLCITESIDQIKSRILDSRLSKSEMSMDIQIQLINTEKSDFGWVYRKGNDIGVINVPLLQETILFYKNLADLTLPLLYLDIPISIHKSDFGPKIWNTLINLQQISTDRDKVFIINDPRLLKNGFGLEIIKDEVIGSVNLCIREIWKDNLGFEVEELKQILYLMETHKDVLHCRTFRVKYFIETETHKMCEEKLHVLDGTQINDLLHHWQECVTSVNEIYVTRKSVLVPLHTL